MNGLALCAGIGGLELGVRLAADCRTVCYVEREAFAAAVLVARMEAAQLDRAPVADDLRSFDGRAWRGVVDLVTAGYPCQPFSVAGKRLGDADERHLWPEVRRILDECGAPLAFLENVPGHVHLGLADVLADLAALGFDAEWGLFSAEGVGAPHRRERLFVLAYRVADGHLDGREVIRLGGLLDGEREERGDDADGCGEDVADAGPEGAIAARLKKQSSPLHCSPILIPSSNQRRAMVLRRCEERSMVTSKLSGYEAIGYAERTGATLNKYADPVEGARESLTVDEARQVAREDAGLIWVAVEPCEGCQAPATVSRDCGGGVAWWCSECDAIAAADVAE